MIRSIFATAALMASLSLGAAYAQTVTPGFDPVAPLPDVSLPKREPSIQTPTPAPRASETVSTTINRSGGTSVTTDRNKAPEGALEAAAGDVAIPSSPSPETTDENGKNKYTAGTVLYGSAKAYDGHSLLVDGNPVRLNGIEAPGADQTCFTAKGMSWKCGHKAYERLASLVNNGKVRCVVDAPAGHGAAATCSGSQVRDVAELLVSEGLAVPNRQSASKYTAAANAAYRAKRGMWMGRFEDPAQWRLDHQ